MKWGLFNMLEEETRAMLDRTSKVTEKSSEEVERRMRTRAML
jgi:hypothetical protein